MRLPLVNSAQEVMEVVREIGFLPMFHSSIAGFSLAEMTPEERWFKEGMEGPWEWREVLAASEEFAYGKLFSKKAGFIHKSILPAFINFRRDGYDFDARYEDSLAPEKAKRVIDCLTKNGSLKSPDIKRAAGFDSGGIKGFDGVMALLQMQTYITVMAFDYKMDAYGKQYGFGVGRYGLLEDKFGAGFAASAYEESVTDSRDAILERLITLCPQLPKDKALKFISA